MDMDDSPNASQNTPELEQASASTTIAFTETNLSENEWKLLAAKFERKRKPVLKLLVIDLLTLPYDAENKTYSCDAVSDFDTVLCGGILTNIFRNDNHVFSFTLDDNTGTITCYHSVRTDYEKSCKNLLMQLDACCANVGDFNFTSEDSTIFCEDTTLNATERHDEAVYGTQYAEDQRMIRNWCQKALFSQNIVPSIGDTIHLVGFLHTYKGERTIKVADMYVLKNTAQHQDLLNEMDYLYKNSHFLATCPSV